MRSPIHEAARDWASRGIPVFPCRPGSKEPATPRGFHDATTDLAQIDAWWTEHPDYNLAFQPQKAGWAVIDPDGADGIRAWEELELEYGTSPETMTVRTPRGGLHLYFKGDLPPSQSKLAPHVDTRGGGSYVLVPPSRTASGEYTYLNSAAPAELPPWIGRRLAELSEVRLHASDIELDLPVNVARAKAYLDNLVKRGDVAIEGQMGDLKTFVTACWCLNLGCSPEKTTELLLDHWNDHCQPPWDPEELATKVENASRYAQNGEGAWAVEPTRTAFANALDKLGVNQRASARQSRFKLLSINEQNSLPEPEWLIPNLLTTNAIGMIYGPSMTFKSFLGVDLGMSLASGLQTWDLDGTVKPVVYVAGEGPFAIATKRRPAWQTIRQVDGEPPFYLVGAMPTCAVQSQVDEFIAQVRESDVKPGLVIIDTLARFMLGLDESSAKDASIATAALEYIKEQLRCSVLCLHHTGKNADRGARGSSALLGNFDAQHEIVRADGTLAVALHPRKQKDAELGPAWLFEGKAVAKSLVFDPIGQERWNEIVKPTDKLINAQVGAALQRMNAFGPENKVTTRTLAVELCPAHDDETVEQHLERVERKEQALRRLAKGNSGLSPEPGWWWFPKT